MYSCTGGDRCFVVNLSVFRQPGQLGRGKTTQKHGPMFRRCLLREPTSCRQVDGASSEYLGKSEKQRGSPQTPYVGRSHLIDKRLQLSV